MTTVETPGRRSSAVRFISLILLPAVLLLPVFFQLDGTLFTGVKDLVRGPGQVTRLPLPVSVVVCFVGAFVWARAILRLRDAWLLLAIVPLMCLTSVIASGWPVPPAKLKLLVGAYALPLVAFPLGLVFARREGAGAGLARGFIYTLAIVVPAQLTNTWFDTFGPQLAESFFVFGIYDYLQYVAPVLMAGYLLALFGLWGQPDVPAHARWIALLLGPVMGTYAAASISMMVIGGLCAGLFLFAVHRYRTAREKLPALVCLATVVAATLYLAAAIPTSISFGAKFKVGISQKPASVSTTVRPQTPASARLFEERMQDQATKQAALFKEIWGSDSSVAAMLPPNVAIRLGYWKYFASGAFSSPTTLLIGHPIQPDISKFPSAHNYYLDFLYNFGLLPLIPLLVLLFRTLRLLNRHRSLVLLSPPLFGHAVATVSLLLVDNALRVGMRTPYPGIVTFFLWGVLLVRLETLTHRTVVPDPEVDAAIYGRRS